MATYRIKAGDTRPTLRANLRDAKKRAIPLAGASVLFLMKPKPGLAGVTIAREADILDEDSALVEFVWGVADTSVAGLYDAEFEITFVDGSVETVPNDGFIDVVVLASLDSEERSRLHQVGLHDVGAHVS